MTDAWLLTATNQYVEADGIRFGYRRFGTATGPPLVFLQHFRGNFDTHDPAITDPLAQGREVIVFNTSGIASSTGEPRTTIDDIARDAITFVEALGLEQIDLLGHSMGGHEAQLVAAWRPDLVRRLILVGTGPRGGEGMDVRPPGVGALFTKTYEPQDLMWGPIFFSASEKGQAAANAYYARTHQRADRDTPVSDEAKAAHWGAARAWGQKYEGSHDYLADITQPTLVVNGSNDVVVPTVNSFILQQEIPNARLVLYPDSNHGAHFEYHEHFTREAAYFLDQG